jgi:hypothetical protein
MKPYTKQCKIKEEIQALEVGQSFSKKEFITLTWGRTDYFIQRSFDVLFNNCKKQFEDREFKTVKGFILRTK